MGIRTKIKREYDILIMGIENGVIPYRHWAVGFKTLSECSIFLYDVRNRNYGMFR